MQIEVLGADPHLTTQIRTYAEYRVFSRLAPLARDVTTVLVVLTRSSDDRYTVCALSADLGAAGCVRARRRHAHPTGAIDAATDHLADALRRLPAATLG
jgi:ribosome-associated translation inhibitor RaiA